MAITAHDLLMDAGLWHRVYPGWPLTGNPGTSPCGHAPQCSCATPAITPARLDALAADWDAEIARADLGTGSDEERGGR